MWVPSSTVVCVAKMMFLAEGIATQLFRDLLDTIRHNPHHRHAGCPGKLRVRYQHGQGVAGDQDDIGCIAVLHALQGAAENPQFFIACLQAVVTALIGKQGIEKDQVHLFENRVLPEFLGRIGDHRQTTEPGVGDHDGDAFLLQQSRAAMRARLRLRHNLCRYEDKNQQEQAMQTRSGRTGIRADLLQVLSGFISMSPGGLITDGLAITARVGAAMHDTGFLINDDPLGTAEIKVEVFFHLQFMTLLHKRILDIAPVSALRFSRDRFRNC